MKGDTLRLACAGLSAIGWMLTAPVGAEQRLSFPPQIGPIEVVAFSPDGRRALSGSDNEVKIWDMETGAELRSFPDSPYVKAAAFSPDGRQVLAAFMGTFGSSVLIGNVDGGQEPRSLTLFMAIAMAVTFSQEGEFAAVQGEAPHTLQLMDLRQGRAVRLFDGAGAVQAAVFSPGGALLATEEGKLIKIWDVATGSLLRTLEGHAHRVDALAFSADGLRLLSGEGDVPYQETALIKLWDVSTGKEVMMLSGHQDNVKAVALSPDLTRAASGGRDQKIYLWSLPEGKLLQSFEAHGNQISALAFSPDGRRLLSGGWDNQLKLWDLAGKADGSRRRSK